MDQDLLTEFPAGADSAGVLERLSRVLDPELDEPILQLGFVESLRLHDGHVTISLRLPTNWCAINFVFIMAEDVRAALLAADGIRQVTVRLGDHCSAEAIEAAVNNGKPFASAFPGESGAGLAALRTVFLRKGFLVRQERLLRELRAAGLSAAAISGLRVCEEPESGLLVAASANSRHRYLERRTELGFDCSPAAPLIVDQSGNSVPAERLDAYYQHIRTVRVSMEANGSFCRAVLAAGRAAPPATTTNGREAHVQA